MKQFEDVVLQSIRHLSESGKLETMIQTKIEKTVEDIVENALRSYSEFGRNLEKAIQETLKVDLSQLGLPGYNNIVLGIVQRKLGALIETMGAQQLEKDLENLLGTSAPEVIKLSELVEKFKEWVRSDNEACDDAVTAILEKSQYRSYWLYLDKDSNTTKYSCAIQLGIGEDGKLFSVTLRGTDVKKDLFMGNLYGFERDMFFMHAAKTRVIVDTEYLEETHPNRYDY
jgi:hypothetical protein